MFKIIIFFFLLSIVLLLSSASQLDLPEDISNEDQQYIQEQYEKFMKERQEVKEKEKRITRKKNTKEEDEEIKNEQKKYFDSLSLDEQKLVIKQREQFQALTKEEQAKVYEEYVKYTEDQRLRKKSGQKQPIPQPEKGISPKDLKIKRDINSKIQLSQQVDINGGLFWFGTQMVVGEEGKIIAVNRKDGAEPRIRAKVKNFKMDIDCVTNEQFAEFVKSTSYITEAELYKWSFVLDSLASNEVIASVDSKTGYGRVKEAKHWMAVEGASWKHPFGKIYYYCYIKYNVFFTYINNKLICIFYLLIGLDSNIDSYQNYPVCQVSFLDAVEYCSWAGDMRLPTEKEWEYAARGGRVNQSYPWGTEFIQNKMNIWDGKFPNENTKLDGYHGLAPVKSYDANKYGLYNMVGNVWEWVLGGKAEKRILRGGSFVDSKFGEHNHAVMVSTRQTNSGDSAGNNVGFRCVKTIKENNDNKNIDNANIDLEL